MNGFHHRSAVAALLIFALCGVLSGQSENKATVDPKVYLNRALDQMEKLSYYGSKTDWKALRKKVFEKAGGANSTRDTYPALRLAVRELGDMHAFLIPAPDPDAPKVDGEPGESGWVVASTSNDLRSAIVADGIGYLLVPSFGGEDSFKPDKSRQFAIKIRSELEKINPEAVDGWIIDLRFNSGGNMWPMLAGLAPFLPAGEIGYFEVATGQRVPWLNAWGSVGTKSNKAVDLSDREPIELKSFRVVVLYGKYTLSSGEAVAVALRSNPRTVSIGSATGGAANATQPIWLGDGAMLFITTAIYVARDGTRYGAEVTPDRIVEGGPHFAKDLVIKSDPLIRAAAEMLREMN